MAVKKDTQATGTAKEEKTAKHTPEEVQTADEEVIKIAYIGPTLPAGQLKCNKIFIGTEAEIMKELEPVLEKYPLVEKMLVPASQMGEKKDKVKTAGNILHKYYADLVSGIAGNKTREG